MFSLWKKSEVEVPKGDSLKLETVKLTLVRWRARYGAYHGEWRECVEAFPNPKDAEVFAQSLRDAYKLLRHTSGTDVRVETQK